MKCMKMLQFKHFMQQKVKLLFLLWLNLLQEQHSFNALVSFLNKGVDRKSIIDDI